MTRTISPLHPTVAGLAAPRMIRLAAATDHDAVGLRLCAITAAPAFGCIAGTARQAEEAA